MTSAEDMGDDNDVLVIEGLGHRRSFSKRALIHMVAGAALGFVLSLTLSSIMYEIVRDTAFAVVDVGVLLAAAVALFLKQVRAAGGAAGRAAPSLSFEQPASSMLTVVRIGAACVAAAAVCVIVVAATALPPALKFFLVTEISAAHCYLLVLGSVEFFNYAVNGGSPLIARQLYTVAIAAVAVGCVSGFVFGLADVEVHERRLGWEEWVAAAICIVSGAAVGHANAVAVDDVMEIAFEPLPMDETS